VSAPGRLDIYAAVARGEITAADAQAMLATAATGPADRAWFPLSYGQQSLWVVSETAPGNAAYNVPIAYRVDRNLDTAALQRALQSLGALHPALRTVLSVRDGVPGQLVLPEVEIGIVARTTIAEGDVLTVDLAFYTFACYRIKRGGLHQLDTAFLRAVDDGCCQWMLATSLEAGSQFQ